MSNLTIMPSREDLAVPISDLAAKLQEMTLRYTDQAVLDASCIFVKLLESRETIAPYKLYLYIKATIESQPVAVRHRVSLFLVSFVEQLLASRLISREYVIAYRQFAVQFERERERAAASRTVH